MGQSNSRMDQVWIADDGLWKIWRDMVCLSRPYPFNFFKGCLPQVLLVPFLNTCSHILFVAKILKTNQGVFREFSCRNWINEVMLQKYFFKRTAGSRVHRDKGHYSFEMQKNDQYYVIATLHSPCYEITQTLYADKIKHLHLSLVCLR